MRLSVSRVPRCVSHLLDAHSLFNVVLRCTIANMCRWFHKNQLPCKHLFWVLCQHPTEWTWHSLPESMRNSARLLIDTLAIQDINSGQSAIANIDSNGNEQDEDKPEQKNGKDEVTTIALPETNSTTVAQNDPPKRESSVAQAEKLKHKVLDQTHFLIACVHALPAKDAVSNQSQILAVAAIVEKAAESIKALLPATDEDLRVLVSIQRHDVAAAMKVLPPARTSSSAKSKRKRERRTAQTKKQKNAQKTPLEKTSDLQEPSESTVNASTSAAIPKKNPPGPKPVDTAIERNRQRRKYNQNKLPPVDTTQEHRDYRDAKRKSSMVAGK